MDTDLRVDTSPVDSLSVIATADGTVSGHMSSRFTINDSSFNISDTDSKLVHSLDKCQMDSQSMTVAPVSVSLTVERNWCGYTLDVSVSVTVGSVSVTVTVSWSAC